MKRFDIIDILIIITLLSNVVFIFAIISGADVSSYPTSLCINNQTMLNNSLLLLIK